MRIQKTACNFEREPLRQPFGFKGGYLKEIWQTVARLENPRGLAAIGVGTQSSLWSDARVFAGTSAPAAEAIMFLATAHALKSAEKLSWETPLDLFEQLFPPTYAYAKAAAGREDLRATYALNGLVAVDNAAWVLYAKEKGFKNFDEMVPAEFRSALPCRHKRLACIPLFSYGVALADITAMVKEGFFFAKIKIGADPDKDGDQDKMLAWDQNRLSAIHERLKDCRVEWTENGLIPYYLDANGRYDSKDRLRRLLDHADRIGALSRILLVEEPFPEEYKVEVKDLPARIAADESLHSEKDALERIALGYGAMALKPIAKTLSLSLKVAKLAAKAGVPCFCADLTVNPILVEWNKMMSARLAPLPGMKIGAFESNGAQNYLNWTALNSYHPCAGAPWVAPRAGIFNLDDDFYARSGGILEASPHYASLVASPK